MDFLNVFFAFIVAIFITLSSVCLATIITVVFVDLYVYFKKDFKKVFGYDKGSDNKSY